VTHPTHDLGAYALGGLDAEEEAAVREHLARCSSCRDQHARLAALRPLLDLAEEAPERPALEAPSPLLEEAVLAGFAERGGATKRGGRLNRGGRAKRSGSGAPSGAAARGGFAGRWRVALPSALAGAALAVAVLALAGVFGGDGSGDRPSTTVELRGDAGSARAVIEAAEAGTVIELEARLPPSGRREHYDVFMVSGDYRISAGSFRVGADGRVTVELACGGPPEVYDTIEIRQDDRAVLKSALPA
jgi:anti-sigma factor RsiW